MTRVALLFVAVPALLLAGAGCSKKEASAAGATTDCSKTLRRPLERRVVVYEAGELKELDVDCGRRSRCVLSRDGALVTLKGRQTLGIQVGERRWQRPFGDYGQLKSAAHLKGAIPGFRIVGWFDAGHVEVFRETGEPERIALPSLAPHERIVSIGELSGGLRLSLVAAHDQDERARDALWLRPPSAEARAWPDGARLIVHERELVGWVEGERGKREFVSAADGARRPVTLEGGMGEPPFALVKDDVLIERAGMTARLSSLDGKSVRLDLKPFDETMFKDGGFFLLRQTGLGRVTPGGIEPLYPLEPGRDLRGKALAAGARVARLRGRRVSKEQAIIIERVVSSSCRAEDRVHLFDFATRELSTIAEGDRMRVHPFAYDDKPAWVEARTSYVFAGAD
jgi:hypothetical protein